MDYSSSAVHNELAFVLANEKTLFKGLSSNQILELIELVRKRAESSPIVLRRSFQKFGGEHLGAEVGSHNSSLRVPSLSPTDSAPTPKEITEAIAVVELRGIILKHPKKSTRLIPSDWSRRFRPYLGTYRQFVESKSPTLFEMSFDEASGLMCVSLSRDAPTLLLRYQRLIDTHGKSVEAQSNFPSPDDQYMALTRISDLVERYRICGGKEVYDRAIEVIEAFVQRCGKVFDVAMARKSLSDAGIVPLPLEWFSNVVVLPGDGIYILRESYGRIQSLDEGNLMKRVCSEVLRSVHQGVPFVKFTEISSHVGLSQIELEAILAETQILLYAPGKGYTCTYFEELVYGYVSPKSVMNYHKSVELLNMSPVRHLVLSLEKTMECFTDKRLPVEYFIAWCSALDLEPRIVWRCVRDKIFWSGSQSDFQVVLRSKSGRKQTLFGRSEEVPSDMIQSIKQEIRKLGYCCTIDKLSSNLRWGKQSEYAKKYGPLRDVLQDMSDVFYEPNYLYLRASIDGLVSWPDEQTESLRTAQACLDELETKFTTMANLSSMIVYQMVQSGLGSYPLHQVLDLLANAGCDHDLIYSLDYIYVPDSIVYLRRAALSYDIPTDDSIESAVIRALRNSPRYSVDYDGLIGALLGSRLYQVDEIDAIRQILECNCSSIDQTSEGLGRLCFFNPNIIALKSVTKEQLAMEFGEYPILSPAKVKRKLGSTSQGSGNVEIDAIEISETSTHRGTSSKWCVMGAVVFLHGSPNRSFVVVAVDGENVSIRSQSNAGEQFSVKATDLGPKPVRTGDSVKVLDGPYKDSIFHVVGSTGTTVSLQISKFEFKSLPMGDVVCVTEHVGYR